jgi:23S rRNA pseudouridine2605 synthase
MRLQRALARAGVASRRAAEDLIREGKVRVNGRVALIGMNADPDRDLITVAGRRIAQARTVWLALHKPVGYVVTRRDPEARPTVFSLIPEVPGLTYVGRLDVMTSGLLLLTTDGESAHRLMHPRFEVERIYRVVVHGRTEPEIRSAFNRGIVVDGREVNVIDLKIRPAREGMQARSLDVLLGLAEGRYRIVRRICEQLGLKVERLVRLSYGPIRLGTLQPGTWRYLDPAEIKMLSGGTVRRDRPDLSTSWRSQDTGQRRLDRPRAAGRRKARR